ncbi:MAG: glycine/sarcosine/betaine reductase selenoprotein B family protein [Rhodospirillaceae bacterium]|nr:glycine/sarcosine/betaine reductase selenoprotein B family protein [Rhodospirillaceae bacterium]
MVRLVDVDPLLHDFLRDYDCPKLESQPWTPPPALKDMRVAIISTAGLKLKTDRPFASDSCDYRVIPADKANDVVQDHVSAGHDRIGFMDDVNIVFPLQRLKELAEAGEIGSVADFHYSFMGAVDARKMEPAARQLAGIMKEEAVNAVILTPV